MLSTPPRTPTKKGNIFRTPTASPSSKKCYGDRFIPCRSDNPWHVDYQLAEIRSMVTTPRRPDKTDQCGSTVNGDLSSTAHCHSALVYASFLQNEILGTSIADYKETLPGQSALSPTAQTPKTPGQTGSCPAVGTPSASGVGSVGQGGVNSSTSGRLDGDAMTGPESGLGHKSIASPQGVCHQSPSAVVAANKANRNLFSFTPESKMSPRATLSSTSVNSRISSAISAAKVKRDAELFSLSPVSVNSQLLLRSPRRTVRRISKIPFKILDAPELQDDFYLNLVDWSSQNVLAVGLGSSVYLWSASTSQVTRLCDLNAPLPPSAGSAAQQTQPHQPQTDSVTSVAWSDRGNLVAVGTSRGLVQIWDVSVNKRTTMIEGHTARVGALAWNAADCTLASGSRDRSICQRDVLRTPTSEGPVRKLVGHRQEVCGLRWSPDSQLLASGGNDNRLFVWSNAGRSRSNANIARPSTDGVESSDWSNAQPVHTFTDHIAAVKAIAWSPHQHGLLASGGGTADRSIRFWNTLTGQAMQAVDTGSQVCNLAWSKHASELVSTHGYSQNQIVVWKYPSLMQVAKLTGHSYRVLYLAVSPEGEAIVTGAGDETLRFWNVFSKARSTKESKSVLNLFTSMR